MVCPICHGTGRGYSDLFGQVPCFECQGSGVASYCDAAGTSDQIMVCPQCGSIHAFENACGRRSILREDES